MENPQSLISRWPLRTAAWLIVALVTSEVLTLMNSPLVPLPGLIALVLVPGAAIMSTLHTRPANTAGRLVLAITLSLMVIMVVGGVASLLGPHMGVAHPLDQSPQRVIWAGLAVVVLVSSWVTRRDPVEWIFEGVRSINVTAAIGSGLLVVLSILGVAQLNHGGDNRLAVISTVLDVVVLLVGIVGGWKRTSRWPLSTMLYGATLAILFSTSLRGGHLYGWDIQQEFGVASHTIYSGLWVIPANHDPYASMLSLTVLPTVLHSLVRLRLTAFFDLVVPAVLALLPLAVFSTVLNVPRWVNGARRPPRPGLALGVVAGIIVSSEVFPSELPAIGRQSMALTMLAALVMVLFDRAMSLRRSQVVIGLLILAISFTHYSTSYLVAFTILVAWCAGSLWSRGWLGTPRARIQEHRSRTQSRTVINGVLVALAFVAAFGWNVGITRNNALSAPSGALTTRGVGLATSTGTPSVSAAQLENLLVSEMHKTSSWLVPVAGSRSVRLQTTSAPASPGIAPSLDPWWNRLSLLTNESIWFVLGIALLFGIFRLGRRRSDQYSSELVGLAVAGLLIGAVLRFSGTLAAFYNPERGAIMTAIFLSVPVTMFLDDAAARLTRASVAVGVLYVGVLATWTTGLGTLFFGGQAPASLTARGENVERFTVSTPELSTAVWLKTHVDPGDVVQSDRYGQLVLLSEPGHYDLVSEIVPPEVDHHAYVYLSSVNLDDDRSRAAADSGRYESVYRSNVSFFNRSFYVVYSTGATRVYH
jgi:uncharacterized membrane protein